MPYISLNATVHEISNALGQPPSILATGRRPSGYCVVVWDIIPHKGIRSKITAGGIVKRHLYKKKWQFAGAVSNSVQDKVKHLEI